jgi:DNA polymerase-3 subunit alpha
VTVGGLITQAKRIRTKSGDPMMFATLDDLEGQVEMLIFNSAYASNESNVGVDRRVIVRGRVDHKDRGETKLVVQEVEPFEPTPDEIAAAGPAPPAASARAAAAATTSTQPVVIKLDARFCDDNLIVDLKALLGEFPGPSEVHLEMVTANGPRRLRFGPGYRVRESAHLRAEIDHLVAPEARVA